MEKNWMKFSAFHIRIQGMYINVGMIASFKITHVKHKSSAWPTVILATDQASRGVPIHNPPIFQHQPESSNYLFAQCYHVYFPNVYSGVNRRNAGALDNEATKLQPVTREPYVRPSEPMHMPTDGIQFIRHNE